MMKMRRMKKERGIEREREKKRSHIVILHKRIQGNYCIISMDFVVVVEFSMSPDETCQMCVCVCFVCQI